MADLTFVDVLVIGLVATVGVALVSYWWSGVMVRRGWSWQVRKQRPPRPGKAARGAKPKRGGSVTDPPDDAAPVPAAKGKVSAKSARAGRPKK